MTARVLPFVGEETSAQHARNALCVMSLLRKNPDGSYHMDEIDANAIVARLWKIVRLEEKA